jgi:uncharacterized membrane protein YagU involved in acid resistance
MNDKTDIRACLAMIFTGISSCMTYVGDQVAFVRPPRGVLENLISLTHIVAYKFTDARLYADIIAYFTYAGMLLVMYLLVAKWIDKKVVWPRKLQKMMKELSLHKDLANQYNRSQRGDCIM